MTTDSLTTVEQMFSTYGLVNEFSQRYEDLVSKLLNTGQWQSIPEINESSFNSYLVDVFGLSEDYSELSESEFKSVLRKFRNLFSTQIIWHDINGKLDWRTLFKLQSDLADVCMRVALNYVEQSYAQRYQVPVDEQGNSLQLCVIAMGKWGGRELNFSSDIDYIYLYAESGEVENVSGTKSLDHHQYFLRQAQKVNQLLDDVTADGFVYRCDTRLRPFGDSGSLVVSLAALEQYLFQHGREWERYAYLKARCITGDESTKDSFHELCRPFVYRKYLDYGVYANLRDMHGQIADQVHKKNIQENLKLGRGGIRECEFLVQSIQLIRGGRNSELQQSNFYAALQRTNAFTT